MNKSATGLIWLIAELTRNLDTDNLFFFLIFKLYQPNEAKIQRDLDVDVKGMTWITVKIWKDCGYEKPDVGIERAMSEIQVEISSFRVVSHRLVNRIVSIMKSSCTELYRAQDYCAMIGEFQKKAWPGLVRWAAKMRGFLESWQVIEATHEIEQRDWVRAREISGFSFLIFFKFSPVYRYCIVTRGNTTVGKMFFPSSMPSWTFQYFRSHINPAAF